MTGFSLMIRQIKIFMSKLSDIFVKERYKINYIYYKEHFDEIK